MREAPAVPWGGGIVAAGPIDPSRQALELPPAGGRWVESDSDPSREPDGDPGKNVRAPKRDGPGGYLLLP